MKHLTLSVFFFLLGILNINAQAARNVLALEYNSKNCILQKNDGNFFIGGAFKTVYPPFVTTKIGVVNNNITENYSLTNIGFFSDPNVDQVYAVEKSDNWARNPYAEIFTITAECM